MKKFPALKIAIFLLLIVSALSSCKQKSSLADIDPTFAQYISAFTYGNISPESFIQIELAQEMPAVELNAEIKDELFSFSPTVKGKAYWVNASAVQFVPEPGELKPGKTYEAKFYLDKVLKVEKPFASFNFGFHVNEQNFSAGVLPYSPLSVDNLAWNTVQVALQLSNPASVDDVRKMFSIKGAPAQTVINVAQASNTAFHVSVDSIPRSDKPQRFALTINGAAIGADKSQESEIAMPAFSKENFEVVDVRMESKPDAHLRITFSDPLSTRQDLQGLVTITQNLQGGTVATDVISNFTYQIDKNVLKIYPEKLPDSDFTLNLYQPIQNHSGLILDKSYSYQIAVQGNSPEIKLEKSGNILPNSEQLTLPFSAVNLWAVDVKVVKIFSNNVLYYLQSGTLNGNSSGEVRRFGRLVMKKQIRLDADKKLDLAQWNRFSLDLAPLIKQDPGALYQISFSMKQEYSLYPCGGITPAVPANASMRRFGSDDITDDEEAAWDTTSPYYYEPMDWEEYVWEDRDNPCTKSYYMNYLRKKETFVTASNIGIIAKSGNGGKMNVAVTDILSAKPLSGAKVSVYNYQLQVMGSGTTDGNGFVEIDYKKGRPFVVTASKDNDTGYLEVKDEASLSLSNFDVAGKEVQKGLKGYIYGERGVWRPGDTIYLSFILEDKASRLPKGHPVSLEVYTPTRQFYQRQVKTEGENGFYTFRITTAENAPTGVWQSFVKVGGTSFYKSLRIETVKPNRLKVRLETDSIINASLGYLSGTLSSQWLHGAPASNLKAEIELSLSRIDHPFKGFTQYVFNNPTTKFETNQHTLFEGTLNASGEASVNAKIPAAENAPGMLRGNIVSKVYETGGDMSFYGQTLFYSPYASYVGIKAPESKGGYLETDTALPFDIVTLNAYGKKVSSPRLTYKIYKLAWSWWWDSNNEDFSSYVNNTAVVPVAQGSFGTTNGSGKVNFQVNYPDWGRYLILVKDTDSGHTSGTVFFVDWPSWRGRANKTDPNGLTMLSFSTDKPTYEPGEKATVIIPKSSEGHVLISIENGSRVVQQEWVKTSASKDTKYSFKVTEEMNPNFYIFATLLQPHAQTENDLPIRMYGIQNIGVEDKNSRLTPVIAMADELQPEKEFTVSISEKTKKPMTYTLAIVDEGLLDLTSFKTPNAWDEFYAHEALGVRTWDLFDRVIGAHTGMFGPLLSVGGDETLKPSNEQSNRFKPVVKFAGVFSLKGGETKKHSVKLPPYVGSVRVMVVAGGNGAYGNAEKTVAVKNALMTLSTLPRVMGINEETWLPVNVFAMDKKVKNAQITVETNGLLTLSGEASNSVTFDNTGDKVVYFKLKTASKTGAGQVRIKATGGGETVTETIDIAVRNPNPPVIIGQEKLIEAGANAAFDLQLPDLGGDDWAKLELSRLPSVDLSGNMAYLLDYPHGCSEQITSQAFPVLYVDGFITVSKEQKETLSAKVSEVIRMLASRQASDGGFVYWPGDHYSSEWISSYAGHFLLEAKRKGYDVPENITSKWLQFQQKTARSWTPTNHSGGYYSLSMTELQQAYRLYTLALNATPELGAMNRMREMKDLSLQARWQLSAAYAIAGKTDVANELIFNIEDKISPYSYSNDTYGSSARDEAMIMETYLLLGKTEKALALAQDVAQSLSSGYVSTQTAAFGLKAMAQLAEKMGKGNIQAEWTLNGKKMPELNTPNAFVQMDVTPAKTLSVSLSNKGAGAIYARLTAHTQTQTDADTINVSKASLKLAVRYTDKNANPIDVKSLKQGTEITAAVTVSNPTSQALTDLALTQVFASGWEIINDRLMNTASAASAGEYSYRDIRDDRVLTYFNLAAGQSKTFRVQLQAAYRGYYFLPAISCQAMYNPREQARTSGVWVCVEE
ncbi:MAG: hypothetical protein LBR48_02575 [Dysgonamonadaceae bacterium]|jgi:uncharacterized protein YfaS (alpha-2-macroglobulin family)|nr:hypothetical protein [Dysgonamonadaceae bacterium]